MAGVKRVLLGALILVLFSTARGQPEKRWRLDLEASGVLVGYNDVQIPRDSGTRFSLCQDLTSDLGVAFRARLGFALTERHHLSLLAAPFSIISEGYPTRDIRFLNTVFSADTNTIMKGIYRFDSYRVTYRYDFLSRDYLQAGIGITAKLRDAAIVLERNDTSVIKTNTGFVPLVHFRANWLFNDAFGLLLEGDALAAAQGRAEDVLLAAQFLPRPNLSLRLGYRLLEGGADVAEVYNYALLHYIAFGVNIGF